MKNLFSLICLLSISITTICQVVNIPDANFKAALVSNPAINNNGDSEIQVIEAAAYTNTIAVDSLSIYDLTGIEAFTSITGLSCSNNELSSINVSANTALIYLDFSWNHIQGVNLSANTSLQHLNTSHNFLQQGLNVSSNTGLVYLYCTNNSLINLDLSANTALIELRCDANSFMSLDVSANINLKLLSCCTNYIQSLDVSANTALTTLYCISNSLSSLNVKNGNNVNFSAFSAIVNHNLNCVKVDDADWATANWSSRVDNASFSEECNCSAGFIVYPDSLPLHYIAENQATGEQPLEYIWNWGDGTYDSIAYPTHTYDVAGTYAMSLTITDATGCSDEYWHDHAFKTESPVAYITVINGTTGIEEQRAPVFSVFPNPAYNKVIVQSSEKIMSILVYDLVGRQIDNRIWNKENSTIDVSSLEKGVYMFVINNVSRRVVVE